MHGGTYRAYVQERLDLKDEEDAIISNLGTKHGIITLSELFI